MLFGLISAETELSMRAVGYEFGIVGCKTGSVAAHGSASGLRKVADGLDAVGDYFDKREETCKKARADLKAFKAWRKAQNQAQMEETVPLANDCNVSDKVKKQADAQPKKPAQNPKMKVVSGDLAI